MAKSKLTDQQKALLTTGLFFGMIGISLVGIVIWAQTNSESPLAKQIRDVIGLQSTHPVAVESPPVIEVVEVPDPEPEVEPEPEIIPEPEPKPQRMTITFRELVGSPEKWPKTLKMRSEKQVPIRYNGNLYGQMSFVLGQDIQVESLRGDNQIHGSIDGNHLVIAAHATDIGYWYRETYGENHRLALSGKRTLEFDSLIKPSTQQTQTDHMNDVRYWCYRYYDSAIIEKTQDRLVLRWTPNRDVETDFAFEAREIARYYLLSQGAYGGDDNYASCDIFHKSTGELLGTGTVFIPSLNER